MQALPQAVVCQAEDTTGEEGQLTGLLARRLTRAWARSVAHIARLDHRCVPSLTCEESIKQSDYCCCRRMQHSLQSTPGLLASLGSVLQVRCMITKNGRTMWCAFPSDSCQLKTWRLVLIWQNAAQENLLCSVKVSHIAPAAVSKGTGA